MYMHKSKKKNLKGKKKRNQSTCPAYREDFFSRAGVNNCLYNPGADCKSCLIKTLTLQS